MLSWEYPPVVVGGLGTHVHQLAQALAGAGHEVVVLSRHADGLPRDEVRGGVRIVRVPEDPPVFGFGTDLLAWTMALNHALTRAALATCGRFAPQVVHAHDWLVAHAAVTLAEYLRVPLVTTVHGTEAGRHQGWLPEPVNRSIHSVEWWLAHGSQRVIACSTYMRWEVSRLFDLPGDRVDVIANGVPLERFAVPPERVAAARARFAGEGSLILFVGRLVYEKGIQDLLAAMPRLRRRHRGLRLVVCGTGPLDAELRQQAAALRLGRSVEFTGFLPEADLDALTVAADIACVPSIYEPFGLVALEAAAAGTPLAVADVGGLREFVEPGVTGLRFPASDPAALGAALDLLLTDQILAHRLSRNARAALAERYSWPAIAASTVRTYRHAARGAVPDLRTLTVPAIPVREGNLLAGSQSG
jgi:glycogen(starch) synthase